MWARYVVRKIAFLTILTVVMVIYVAGILSHSSEMLDRRRMIFDPSREEKVRAKISAYLDKQLDELALQMVPAAKSTTSVGTVPPESSQRSNSPEIISLDCENLNVILQKAKLTSSTIFRRENKYGNRGIYFSEFKEANLGNIPIVIKVATIQNTSNPIEQYRFHSALRELKNLHQLRQINFEGAPKVWGSCVQPSQVVYAVTRFADSVPLCDGNGTDVSCAMAQNVLRTLSSTKDPKHGALRFLEKVTCFFSQFEKYGIFMEDFSGANFHFSPSTWDLFLVDADSVVFYRNAPLLSRMSCHTNVDCPKPSGNLWPAHALNRKIYYGCGEMYGVCFNNTCQGIGSSLHTCGVGRWLISALRSIVPVEVYNDYRKLKDCTSETNPRRRCSMLNACSDARLILEKYDQLKKA